MGMPAGIGVVDLMIGFPTRSSKRFAFLEPQLRPEASTKTDSPISYMFKGDPNAEALAAPGADEDPVAATLAEMDRFGVAIGMIGLAGDVTTRALVDHGSRFVASLEVDPNDITGAVRRIREARAEHGIKAVTTFPAGCNPQVPVSDRRYYPVYQTCVDLDIPVVVNAGIAGPRVPSACQDVMHFDQVCYDFPELRVVMRHGAEPWQELAVKLMLKWPGLYYMTSAFAPKYYPKAIIDYANTRGADKVLYAGYHPFGLTLERIFSELPGVPLRDHVWPRFLRENAMEVFRLV
ncbi:MAG: amidohydrolase family protein [Acidimicrobiales bacterium]